MESFELIAVGQLTAFGAASGLIVALVLQPKRGRADTLFLVFSLMLAIWGVVALIRPLDEFSLITNVNTRTALLLTALSGTGFAYFLFIARLIRNENRLVTALTLLLPVVLIATFILIWTGNAGTLESLTTAGSILLVALLLYAVATFWSIMISRETVAPQLRLAGVLLIAAYAFPIITSSTVESWALFLSAAAALWTGWTVLRLQLMQPLKDLNDELRIANSDLRQAVSEVTSERAKRESLNEEIRAVNQLRNDFLEKLGHRLRTPLNSISGYNELLQNGVYGELNERQLDRLNTIGRNSRVLLELINDMLDLNTLDAGRMELSLQPVALKPVFERIILDVAPQRLVKALPLVVDAPPDLAHVLADETRICQVITQLVGNAIKFTEQGAVTLRAVNVRVQEGLSPQFPLPVRGWLTDGDWVIITVEDTGVGIAQQDQGKIFEAFYQTDGEQSSENMGSGLGLAISKRLIDQHEGVMWLKSAPGKGSTFLVALRAFRSVAVSTSQMQVGEKEIVV